VPLLGCVYTSSEGDEVSPNQPSTPTHTVRIDDDLWRAAMNKAHDQGETLTDVIRRALVAYLRD
jgi:predicted HicB family RNase H-like nuclease